MRNIRRSCGHTQQPAQNPGRLTYPSRPAHIHTDRLTYPSGPADILIQAGTHPSRPARTYNGAMARKIDSSTGVHLARKAVADGIDSLTRGDLTTLSRFLLEEMRERHPGRSVEIRVPYAGATQAITGPEHRRGTPPNVVELSAETWVGLCLGLKSWTEEIAAGKVDASGSRADLSEHLPLLRVGK